MAVVLVLATSFGRADAAVPRFDHVVIVMEENHAYSQIIGSPAAPYINSLAAGGALMTQSFGLTHPSQPNYIALFSGSTQGVITDGVYPHSQFTAPNLGAKMIAAGFSFGGFSETMPSVGFDGASAGIAPATYKRKHNPWVDWQDATAPLPANKLPPAVNMPYAGYFPSAAAFASLPTLSFVIPNQLHDMHDGTIAQGDSWLQTNLGAYASWCAANNSLLIVTYDEDDGASGNHVATIFYGACVLPGQYSQTVDHYDVLRTLEEMYALPHDAGSTTATPITSIWQCPNWTDLGSGLAGVNGIPSLAGMGSLAAGSPGSLALSNANPSAPAILLVSFTSTPVAFLGGTLVPFPFALEVDLGTDALGTLTLPFLWPSGVPPATTLYFQYVVQDAAGPHGVSLSDALMGVTP
jgi:acid phosphatase